MPLDIHTRDVTVWPETRRPDTDAARGPAKPALPGGRHGMRADLTTSIVELLHEADGTYFP
jgi:lipopolysaccharide export system protein LptC